MRQESKVQVRIRDVAIGGLRPLICLPLMAEKRNDLREQLTTLVALGPDLLEWRADAYGNAADVEEILSVLEDLRRIAGGIPLIFTLRIDKEGGLQQISQEHRLAVITAAIASGKIDLVDIELCNGEEFIDVIRKIAKTHGCKLILSHHNFRETPDEAFIVGKLIEAGAAGADIAKLAVMPKDASDVLTLLAATNRARNGAVAIPLVTMAMGAKGRISRIAGGLFGSDITFASGGQISAPGQMHIDDLRAAMALVFKP